MKIPLEDFKNAIEIIIRDEKLKSVTIFCNPLSDVRQRVRATRKVKNEILITFGKPNYAEREFLKICKKAKAKPRKTWLKYFPKKSK